METSITAPVATIDSGQFPRPDRAAGRERAAVAAARAPQATGASAEQQRLGNAENLNYLGLGACLLISNLWFLLNVLQYT